MATMVESTSPYQALCRCEEKAGSQAQMARDLGITTTAVWKWFQSTKRMPPNHVLLAEKLYGVSRHLLRPDIYPRDYPPAPDANFYGIDQQAQRVA